MVSPLYGSIYYTTPIKPRPNRRLLLHSIDCWGSVCLWFVWFLFLLPFSRFSRFSFFSFYPLFSFFLCLFFGVSFSGSLFFSLRTVRCTLPTVTRNPNPPAKPDSSPSGWTCRHHRPSRKFSEKKEQPRFRRKSHPHLSLPSRL